MFKKLKITYDGKSVSLLKKTYKNKKNNTCIILAGATTIHFDYIPVLLGMKDVEVIVINNLGHGTRSFYSDGPAITDAMEMIDFHVGVIKELIRLGHASSKINLIGYSMGGMSLINILKNDFLAGIVENAVILCSNNTIKKTAIHTAVSMYDNNSGIFNTKKLVREALTSHSPFFMYLAPISFVTANSESCLADCKICEGMNFLAELDKKKLIKGIRVSAIIGENDFFFDENDVPNLGKIFDNFTLHRVKNGHMLPLESPFLTAKLIMKSIN